MLQEFRFESNSPFLPPFVIPVHNNTFDGSISDLQEMVLSKEKQILESTQPYPKTDSNDWLTNRLYEYSVFSFSDEYPVLEELKKHIHKSYISYCNSLGILPEKVYVTSWANVIRKNGRHITPHHHADGHIHAPYEYAYVSGHISIAAKDTCTYYRNPLISSQSAQVKNIPGEMYLFPSWVEHWTDSNNDDDPRISIAFDIITEEVYNMFPDRNQHFIEL